MSRVPRSTRRPLSREGILRSALKLIDRDGLDAFSVRKLAAAIGTDPMAAYYYFPSKAALFDGVVETVYRGISAAGILDTMAARDRILEAARAMRRAFIRHPRTLPLVATRPAATAEMAPLIDGFLRDLEAAGIPADRLLDVITCITVFVIGHALAQVGEPHGGPTTEGNAALLEAAKRFPRLAAAIAANTEYDPDAQFELGIVALVDGLLAIGAGPEPFQRHSTDGCGGQRSPRRRPGRLRGKARAGSVTEHPTARAKEDHRGAEREGGLLQKWRCRPALRSRTGRRRAALWH